MKRLTKLLALVMVLVMMLGLAPAAALAEGGHTHNWKERSRTEPTCTQPGSVTSVCSCGEKKVESIPALGHAWNEGEILPDEHFPGGKKLHFWCWRCGATKDEPLPLDETDDYGWEPPEEQEEPENPGGEVSPASGEPEGEAKIEIENNGTYFFGRLGCKEDIYLCLKNAGDPILYTPVIDLYRWDKSTGDFVFFETVYSSEDSIYPHLGFYKNVNIYDSYAITDWDMENTEDSLMKIALKARAQTETGLEVESNTIVITYPVFSAGVLLEVEDTSDGRIPEDGWVKVKLTLTNLGTETMQYAGKMYLKGHIKDSLGWWKDWMSELHGDDLNWLDQGSSVEAELWIKVWEYDLDAGVILRTLHLPFSRLMREGRKTVYPDTPKAEVVGSEGYFLTDDIEIVIPLLESPEDPAPAPEPLTNCQPALDGQGDGSAEWSLERCSEHAAVAAEAEGKTPQEALLLWAEALDAEYDEWLTEADESLRPLIEAERAAFEEQLAAYGAGCELRGGKEYAAEKMTELLMHKVSLLCFAREASGEDWTDLFAGVEELDAAPEQELCWRESQDSVVSLQTWETLCADHRQIAPTAEDEEGWRELKTLWLAALNAGTDESWLSADAEGRELIAAERQSFGRWLAAWEALLTARCPEDPALVQELLTQAVRGRTIDWCR